jgi:hypothetical protein
MTDKSEKKPYVTPKLVHYGTIRDMTQGLSGVVPDGYSGRARPAK